MPTKSSHCFTKAYPTLESQPVIRIAFPAAVTYERIFLSTDFTVTFNSTNRFFNLIDNQLCNRFSKSIADLS